MREPSDGSDVLADERAQLLGRADDVGGRGVDLVDSSVRRRRRRRILAHVFTETP